MNYFSVIKSAAVKIYITVIRNRFEIKSLLLILLFHEMFYSIQLNLCYNYYYFMKFQFH
jgi:hypothetical protein